jgi:hypothetical protein
MCGVMTALDRDQACPCAASCPPCTRYNPAHVRRHVHPALGTRPSASAGRRRGSISRATAERRAARRRSLSGGLAVRKRLPVLRKASRQRSGVRIFWQQSERSLLIGDSRGEVARLEVNTGTNGEGPSRGAAARPRSTPSRRPPRGTTGPGRARRRAAPGRPSPRPPIRRSGWPRADGPRRRSSAVLALSLPLRSRVRAGRAFYRSASCKVRST